MASLADLSELVGFFSYSREDDEDSHGRLSGLRERIQRELRGQLGRSKTTFKLWQDKEAISPGKLWEAEIKAAVQQAVFFIPIITPTVIRSAYCQFELEAFLAREAELGRNDLVFPILYIRVPDLEDGTRRKSNPVLSIIAQRQYVDWREFRHRDSQSTDVSEAIERFCGKICDTLIRTWLSPEERQAQGAELRLKAVQEAMDRGLVEQRAEPHSQKSSVNSEEEQATDSRSRFHGAERPPESDKTESQGTAARRVRYKVEQTLRTKNEVEQTLRAKKKISWVEPAVGVVILLVLGGLLSAIYFNRDVSIQPVPVPSPPVPVPSPPVPAPSSPQALCHVVNGVCVTPTCHVVQGVCVPR